MPLYYWSNTDKNSPYNGFHVVALASNEEEARSMAFDAFAVEYGEQAAFHLDFAPDNEDAGMIVILPAKQPREVP